MTWKQEIFRGFLLALGTLQVITNITYLLKKNGIALARKQHQEVPTGISDYKMKVKVIMLFCFGLLFFGESLISYFCRTFFDTAVLVSLVLFAIYAVCEAIYYRYWKTCGFAILACLMLGLFLVT